MKRKIIKKWIKPVKRKTDFPFNILGGKSWLTYQPLGVVGNMSPWNYPFNLAYSPFADLLAAGNRVMLKPSEITPHSSKLLEEMVNNYFNLDEIAVINGDIDVSKIFSQLKFDQLLFTGSPKVGQSIMQNAAKNLVPVTLELGGKTPVISGKSADLKRTVDRLIMGKQ